MKRKIFLVVVVLVALAVVIMMGGLYGMSQLNWAIDNYTRVTNRTDALAEIDKLALQLTIAEKNLIIETDDAELKKILQSEEFKNFMPNVRVQIERLRQSEAAHSQSWVKEMPAQVEKVAGIFDAATEETARLTMLNTERKALEEARANAAIWDEYDAVLLPIFQEINRRWEGGEQAIAKPMMYMLSLKAARATYQRDLERLLSAQTPEEREVQIGTLRNGIKGIVESLRSAPPVFTGEYGKYGRDIAAQERAAARAAESMDKIIDLAKQDSNGAAFRHSSTTVRNARLSFDNATNEMIAKSMQQLDNTTSETRALSAELHWGMIIFSAGAIIVIGVISYFIVNNMTTRLGRIINELENGAAQVTAASGEIGTASQSLAEGATEQAASLEETSSALEQMASMTRQNADNTSRTSATTTQTVNLIEEGMKSVDSMSQAMGEINDSAEKIGNIIKIIEEIAFQTNLLALNAAVEAARAGDAGKGFAVVADEVRNLAQRSAQAARDTASLIGGTVSRVRFGSEVATTLAASFKEIEGGAKDVGRLIVDISTATNEQAQGVDQVNTAVSQMDKVTQQNAASAEECASAAEELSAQAVNLKDMVDDLVALVNGARTRRAAAGRVPPPKPAVTRREQPVRAAESVPFNNAKPRQLPASSGGGSKVMRPHEVIPLDTDGDDFSEF